MTYNDFISRLSSLGLSLLAFAEIANTPYGTVRNWKGKSTRPFAKKELPSWVPAFLDIYERSKALHNPQLADFHRMHTLIQEGVHLSKEEILFLLRRVHALYEWVYDGQAQTKHMKTVVEVMRLLFELHPKLKKEPYYISKLDVSGQFSDVEDALSYLQNHLDQSKYRHASLLGTVARCPEVAMRDLPENDQAFKALSPYYMSLFQLAKRSYLISSKELYGPENLESSEYAPPRPSMPGFSDIPKGVYLYPENGLHWRVMVNDDLTLKGNYLSLEGFVHGMAAVDFTKSGPLTPLFGDIGIWAQDDVYSVAVSYRGAEIWLDREEYDHLQKTLLSLWDSLAEYRQWFSCVWGDV